MADKIKITQQGLQKLKNEYQQLIEEKRPKAVERLQKARAMGDLRENSEYHAAREDLGWIESRIKELEEILKNVEIVEEQADDNVVQMGDTVELEVAGSRIEITLVGDFEADPMQNRFSVNSPLGSALVGRKLNEKVLVETPAGKREYLIVRISRS